MSEDLRSAGISAKGNRLPPRNLRPDVTEKVVAVFVLVLGVVLGLVDQQSGAERGLRVPALIASLFLVASSLNALVPIGAKGRVDDEPEPAEAADPGRAVHRGGTPVNVPPPGKPSPLVSLVLMGLAIWLGLATLTYQDAEPQLTGLSLLAAFLIFSRGLAELPGR